MFFLSPTGYLQKTVKPTRYWLNDYSFKGAGCIAARTDFKRDWWQCDGIRDAGLLDSALKAPFHCYENKEVYPSIQQKAARLGYGLVKNHAFVDGNKRIGAHAMLVFLALNKVELDYTQEELSDLFLKIASGEAVFEDLLYWIAARQS